MPSLEPDMLCLADRFFFGFELWRLARASGADLLWRVRKNMRLPAHRHLPDGSYLSHIYPSEHDRRHKTNGVVVRVIDYRLEGVAGAEPIYRLVASLLDPEQAPAQELAALYHERWEIESSLDELNTHLRGARMVLQSRTPDLVRQEFYGLIMAHFAIRGLMHEAALAADDDPDRLSFIHTVRVIRRKLTVFAAIPPLESNPPFIKACSPRSCRSACRQEHIAATSAASSARCPTFRYDDEPTSRCSRSTSKKPSKSLIKRYCL